MSDKVEDKVKDLSDKVKIKLLKLVAVKVYSDKVKDKD